MKPKRLLPHVTRATVEKDDVIVVEAPGRMTAEEQALITRALRRIWPHNQALVLQDGMTLKIGTYVPPRPPPRRRRR